MVPIPLLASFSNWLDERLYAFVCVHFYPFLFPWLIPLTGFLLSLTWLLVTYVYLPHTASFDWLDERIYVCIWPFLFPWLRPLTGLLLSLTW